uniref:WD repeat domain, phosphoinositide interacting 1 n=1 Tax=Oryzias latipes TaxID=8090 RepID=A0A3P9J5L0_ORYLA
MEAAEGAGATGEADEPRPRLGIGCASFNQDSTSLALGTRTGYKIFSLSSVEQLECIYQNAEVPDVFIAERLFSSSLVVVVSRAVPQRMNIYHFKKGTEICSYSYSSNILAVKLNRQWLVVCLEESIYIHNIKDMKLIQTLLNVPPNPSGLCALSINTSNSFLAYPGSATTGEIVVYGANTLSTVTVISAHDAPLAALTFNTSATKLASASERGTVIRVFSIPEGLRLFEFRRGLKREGAEPATWTSYVGRMLSAASSYLPAQVCDAMSQDRAFATVHLTPSAHSSVCSLVSIQKLLQLLVVTADGQLCVYNVDLQDGGECELLFKHSLFDDHSSTEKSRESADSEQTVCPPSYAATAALPASRPVTATLTGYSEDGGAKRGEVIPEHEFASGPVRLDDENEFPPIKVCRDGAAGCRGGALVIMEERRQTTGASDPSAVTDAKRRPEPQSETWKQPREETVRDEGKSGSGGALLVLCLLLARSGASESRA